MEEHPDSAMCILDSLESYIHTYPEAMQMRYQLRLAQAQNKNYVDFTTDSIMQIVADYYDSHGSANERMLAHYLLGCTYRDMKEAPAALMSYYDAIECADTTSAECDYETLRSLYGQVADVLNTQTLVNEELEALKKCEEYGMKSKDTLNAIKTRLLNMRPYMLMADTASMLKIYDDVTNLCLQYGDSLHFAEAQFMPLYIFLNRQQYDKARRAMSIVESAFMDSDGNIERRREHYYYAKGLFCEGTGNLDSANYYYRRLLEYGFDYDAYRGLLSIYRKYGDIDSVVYFSTMFETSLNSFLSDMHTQSMYNASGMYDYSRNERIAAQKTQEAHNIMVLVYMLITGLVFLVVTFMYIHKKYKMKKTHEITDLSNSYALTLSLLEQAEKEHEMLIDEYSKYKDNKNKEISKLNRTLAEYKAQYDMLNTSDKEYAIRKNFIISHFKSMAIPKHGARRPLASEWDELLSLVCHLMPSFYNRLNITNPLGKQEIYTAVLTRLGFAPSEICILLETTIQRVTNIKKNVNNKLFSENTARTLYDNLLSLQ